MRRELPGSRQLWRMLAVLLLGFLLAACGADDEGAEPTATSAPSGAQPTVAAEVETPDADVASPKASSVPTNVDMSSLGASATPAAALTPDAGASERAASATPDAAAEEFPADVDVADGTSGAALPATPGPAMGGTPSASPIASPVAGMTVSGCDIENVPPYSGEVTTFTLTTDLNYRSGPGPDCGFATQQPLGQYMRVEVIGGPVVQTEDGNTWVQIQALGTQGWVVVDFLEPVEGN